MLNTVAERCKFDIGHTLVMKIHVVLFMTMVMFGISNDENYRPYVHSFTQSVYCGLLRFLFRGTLDSRELIALNFSVHILLKTSKRVYIYAVVIPNAASR